MQYFTKTIATSALVVSSTFAHAGGLANEITEAPVVMAEEPAPAGSSIDPTYIVLGVIAALLIAAAVAEDDDDDVDTMPDASDMRLKTDITQVGLAANGLPMYTYRYLGHDAVFSGVMAQDVLAHTPEAVIKMPGGFYAVDYEMLGMRMERLD